ncbi:hypothetical protein CEP52_003978 [Fusarium oligoseptatum]|uniref:Uncharacterized protein n=1 Tax=Fusarium oligoseptatum TaxID=2604345 RepID=A0A428U5S9_9HYPO|nr:hypothetical protein CEP52_003978 [Fusarium oligoseptatum]
MDASRFANSLSTAVLTPSGRTILELEVAWRNILHLKAPPKLAEAYAVLFPGTDYLQERRFTYIHNIVIGLENGNLEDAIAVDGFLVNEKDIDGWTSLHWAARRGNSYAVAVLLADGADPFLVTDNEKRGPLHLTAQSTSALSQQPPLFSSRPGQTWTKARILERGALLSAVAENNVETAALLLRAGANYKAKTNAGNTILHLSANVGEIPMLSILAKATPQGFHRAWDRPIQSIANKDLDPGSWATTPASGNESWYNFEEMSWYEAEAAAQEDVKNAEKE